MNRLITILILLLFSTYCNSQAITTNTPSFIPRSSKAVVGVEDFNLAARTNFFVPRMSDTSQANDNTTKDTCGRLIYTYDVDGYWYRRCTPSKHWERVGGSASVILPQCGIANGTGIVTWDSLLVFDVTASLYALCCDNVARVTPDTVIVLPPSDPDNPRIDAIVLTRNGIEIDTGIAQANPALPQLDSCELLLTYVLINAGETVPAFVTPNNPKIIYNENYHPAEWTIDSIHNIVMDTADITFPVDGIKDIKITSYTVTDNFFEFHTDSTINLNDYGALKLYIRSPTANGPLRIFYTWYLDGQQQTVSQFTQVVAMGSPVYNIVVVPTSNFSILSGSTASVNNLRINISGASTTFYIDWIQLQSGIPAPTNVFQGFQSIVVNGNSIITPNVSVNGSTATINLPLANQAANTAFVRYSTTGIPSFQTIDLSTPIVTGLLPIINVAPSSSDGDFVQTVGGVSSWVTLTNDTTFVGNGLVRRADPNSNNDTLYFGYSKADSALLSFDTYLGLNDKFFTIQNQDGSDWFKINPTDHTSKLFAYDLSNAASAGLSNVVDFNGGNVSFNLNSSAGLPVSIQGDGINGLIYYTASIEHFFTGFIGQSVNVANTNTIAPIISVEAASTGSPTTGFGEGWQFLLPSFGGGKFVGGDVQVSLLNGPSNVSQIGLFTSGGVTLTIRGDNSILFKPITATAASAITPAEGMMLCVSNTNGTFTSIGFWGYQNGAWAKM